MTTEYEDRIINDSKDLTGKDSLALIIAIGGNNAGEYIRKVINYVVATAKKNNATQKEVWDATTKSTEKDTLRYWLIRASYYVDRHIRG